MGWACKPPSLFLPTAETCYHPIYSVWNYPELLNKYSQRSYDTLNTTELPQGITPVISLQPFSAMFNYINDFYHGYESVADSALLVTEPTQQSLSTSKGILDFVFETLSVKEYFFVKKASAISFAFARSTALIIETGPCSITFSPIFESYNLTNQTKSFPIGGDLIDWYVGTKYDLYNNKECRHNEFFPFVQDDVCTYSDYAKAIHPKTLHLARNYLINQISKNLVDFNSGGGYDANEVDDEIAFQLPDGKLIHFSHAINQDIYDFFFQPDDQNNLMKAIKDSPTVNNASLTAWHGITPTLFSVLFNSDPEIINTLSHNILISGGLTIIPNFADRLSAKLKSTSTINIPKNEISSQWNSESQNLPFTTKHISSLKLKVSTLSNTNKPFSSWIGASILGSLSSFSNYWVTKEEYNEFGTNVLERKVIF